MPDPSASQPRPLVAVVTPVYNGAKHLEETIQAVQAQTYRPLVHCIVDNASTDATPEIIAKYATPGTAVPIVTIRNPETVTFQENSNKAVELAPAEATHFRILHADDTLPPTAIADMMELALQGDDIVLVAGAERMNEFDRPHFFPPECSIYEASNMLARVLSDEAHVPTAHVLVRRDAIRSGEPWYPTDIVECYIATCWRTLSRGGRAGFVHKYNGMTRRYAGSGSLIDTFAHTVKAVLWEKLLFIEWWGPSALSNTEYKRVLKRFLRVYGRRLLWWSVTGSFEMARRDYQRLAERGHRLSPWDFVESVVVWPYYLFLKRIAQPFTAPRWPTDATTASASTHPVRAEPAAARSPAR